MSDLGLTLALREESSREYMDALRSAALNPPLFKEIYETRRESSDDALIYHLIRERAFTKDGAERFVRAYRNTIVFARLDIEDSIAGLEYDEGSDVSEEDMDSEDPRRKVVNTAGPSISEGLISIPVPLTEERIGTVTLPIDMGKADWDRLKRILKAYEPYQDNDLEGD